jgi:RNA polymerase sigma-70 factor, ECF subfamily
VRELPTGDELPTVAQPPDQDALIRRLDVTQALQALGPEDRALMSARYFLDLTQPCAAQLLDMPLGTAKVRLHRIRKQLRHALTDW